MKSDIDKQGNLFIEFKFDENSETDLNTQNRNRYDMLISQKDDVAPSVG